MKVLSSWKKDPRATKESRGYSVYRELLASFPRARGLNPADALNMLPMLPDHPEQVPDRVVALTHKALMGAVESLVKLYGTPTPKWGDINVIQLADGRRFPSGAADSVSQGVWQTSQAPKRAPDGKWFAVGGSDALMMSEMSNPPRVFTMVPYGQSDDPASAHFADQTERYTNKQYKRAWFTKEDVLKNAESTLIVSSKGSG
jgi:acyl-homoserine lactone acylase PvdQ